MPQKKRELHDQPIMGNIDYNEVVTDLFSDDEVRQQDAQNKLWAAYNTARQNKFGFFTPYRSGKEFGLALVSPITVPLTLGLAAGLAAVTAAIGTVTAIGSLFFSGGAALFRKGELAEDALVLAAFSGIAAGIAALATVALAVLAVVLTPLAVAAIVTRSVATLGSAISSNCCHSDCCEENEEQATATLAI